MRPTPLRVSEAAPSNLFRIPLEAFVTPLPGWIERIYQKISRNWWQESLKTKKPICRVGRYCSPSWCPLMERQRRNGMAGFSFSSQVGCSRLSKGQAEQWKGARSPAAGGNLGAGGCVLARAKGQRWALRRGGPLASCPKVSVAPYRSATQTQASHRTGRLMTFVSAALREHKFALCFLKALRW